MEPNPYSPQPAVVARSYDAGLRAHMQRVYNRMTAGVFITAVTAFIVASSPVLLQLFLGGPQRYVVMLAPLAIVWFGFNPMTMPSSRLRLSFGLLSVLYGISLSVILLLFTGESIAQAFFIATGMFAGLSIFGYTTRKDLGGLGTFCFMGVIGALLLGLSNLYFKSEMIMNLVSGISIIAFAGVTAWETQRTKEMYSPHVSEEGNSRLAWAAALSLYISFIAMFQSILQLMGQARD